MKTKAAILIPSALVLLFTIVGGIDAVRAANTTDGAYRQLQVYSEVLSRVRSEYVEDPNLPLVTDGALHGLLESLDPNSSFLTSNEYKDLQSAQRLGQGRHWRCGFQTFWIRFGDCRDSRADRRTKPDSRRRTFWKRSTTNARTKCRWPRFTIGWWAMWVRP